MPKKQTIENQPERKLRIIFVGVPDMALVCLSNLLIKKFNIVGVVPPEKSNEAYFPFKHFAESKNLNFLDFIDSPNEKSYIEKIKSLEADIGVCCSYNLKLSKEFLSSTRLGYINCHPSLLPKYRGAMPYFHIINNGEIESGITLHFMDETFDTGDIIYQEKFELLNYETAGILFNRTTYMLNDALIETLEKIERGEEIKRYPQNKEIKTIKAPKIDGNFRVDWNNSASAIERLIRASNPFFGVWTSFRSTNLKILKAHIYSPEENQNQKYNKRDVEPIKINVQQTGKIQKADEENFIIQTKKGLLALDVFQVGTWGIFDTKDFYNTFSPRCDEFLI